MTSPATVPEHVPWKCYACELVNHQGESSCRRCGCAREDGAARATEYDTSAVAARAGAALPAFPPLHAAAVPFCLSCERLASSEERICRHCQRPLSAVQPVYVVAMPQRYSITSQVFMGVLLAGIVLSALAFVFGAVISAGSR